jgi:serine/threonine-protein kinase
VQTLLPDERWTQIEAVFQEAADLPPDSREAFLIQRCGNDPQLREEVLSLLRYDTREKDPLLDALQASAASIVVEEPTAGRMLGPYRIEREIGRGGMSVVYSAVRADGEFQKRVAIKLIKRGMDTRAVIERLRRERRILAALEHPSIARLLDGGTTADGLPWIAMEYVEGLPIHRYCDEHNLSIEDRCRLFDKVCDAMAYAHRNLVVHRDLKPGNILVANDGSPKLLDFGIAKVLAEADGEFSDDPLTQGHARPLTPGYASPEQLRGGPVGTATDIYSLGVVLYELLTGVRPRAEADGTYCAGRTGADAASATALRARKAASWSAQLRGDLDNILQMALRDVPERRYLSVDQLALDLRRHLTGMPVAARPDTFGYRAAKFVRRNRFGVAAAVALLLALTAGIAVSAVEANRAAAAESAALKESARARTERDRALAAQKNANAERNTALAERERANSEAATAKAVTDFLRDDLLGQANPDTQAGKDLTVRAALDRAAKRIDGTQPGGSGKFEGKPLVEADIRNTIAESYAALGLYPEAQLQYQRAWELRRGPLGEKNRDTLDALTSVAVLDRRMGKLDDAERLYNRILGIQRAEFGESDASTLLTMSNLAVVYSHQDKYAESARLNRKVLAIQRQTLGAEHLDTLRTMNNLGVDYSKLGRFDDAERLYRQLLDIRRRVQGAEHPNTIFTANNLAVVYARQGGNAAEAEKLYRETLDLQRRILGPDHPDTLLTMDNLGLLFTHQPDRYAAAEEILKQTAEARRRVLGAMHPDTLQSQISLGVAEILQLKYTEAEGSLRGTCDAYEQAKLQVWQRYYCEAMLGASLEGQKRFAEAEPLLVSGYQGLRARENSIPANARNALTRAGEWLARLYTEEGKPELAPQGKGSSTAESGLGVISAPERRKP